MILLSNAGSNTHRVRARSDTMAIGTVDGVALLRRAGEAWVAQPRGLPGCFVSALATLSDGTLFAAIHGAGIARSTDGGVSWTWPNTGLDHLDLWAARTGWLHGREVVLAGAQPAHLYISDDAGAHWRELTALRAVASVPHWCFPPPPRIGHIKDIVIDGDRLLVGIEIGALLMSEDGGASFRDLGVDADPRECDIHRVLIHPAEPGRLRVVNGLMGMLQSEDDGATWRSRRLPEDTNYPDAVVQHPQHPALLFLSAGVGWPPHWYKAGRGRGKIARSRDGGATWERLLGGLPDGQRAVFSALTIEAWDDGYAVYAADTDGQVWASTDGGDHWSVIADVAPVSKGDFYRGLVRDRAVLATVDDVVVNPAASGRFARHGD